VPFGSLAFDYNRRQGTVVALIIVGALLILFGVFFARSAPVSDTGLPQVNGESLSSEMVLPQNTTVGIMAWPACSGASPLKVAWDASGPVNIYVLNAKQYEALLLPGMNIVAPPSLQNFSGMPVSWVNRDDLQDGNFTLSLPQGEFYFLAWSSTRVVLNSFVLSLTNRQMIGSCLPSRLDSPTGLVPIALGALALVLAVCIVTRRIWR
jgi:hypothetical protein